MATGISSNTYQSSGIDLQSQSMVDSYRQTSQGATKSSGAGLNNKLATSQGQVSGLSPEQRDTFELSPQMQAALDKAMGIPADKKKQTNGSKEPGLTSTENKKEERPEDSPAAQKVVAELKSADQRVRSHEMAHLAAAGGLARGGASYSFRTGPDGKRYAVSGEVSIDTKPVDGDPKATLTKAMQIQRAALAPADPSPQDRAVAASAGSMASQAQAEISRLSMTIKKPAEKPEQSPQPQQSLPVSQPVKRSYSAEGRFAQNNQTIGATQFDIGV